MIKYLPVFYLLWSVLLSGCIAPTHLSTFGDLPASAERGTILVVPAVGTYAAHKSVVDVVAAALREVGYTPYTDGTIVTPAAGPEVVVSTLDTSYRRVTNLPLRTQLFDAPATDYVAVVTGRGSANRIQMSAISISDRRSGELLYTLDVDFVPARTPLNARDILAIKFTQAQGRLPSFTPETVNRYGLPAEYRGYNSAVTTPRERPIERN